MIVTMLVFVISVVLFISMVLSANAAVKAKTESCPQAQQTCHKWSMWSAVISGLACGAVLAGLVFYIFSTRTEGIEMKSMKKATSLLEED